MKNQQHDQKFCLTNVTLNCNVIFYFIFLATIQGVESKNVEELKSKQDPKEEKMAEQPKNVLQLKSEEGSKTDEQRIADRQ